MADFERMTIPQLRQSMLTAYMNYLNAMDKRHLKDLQVYGERIIRLVDVIDRTMKEQE